jgi:hypothetical protein
MEKWAEISDLSHDLEKPGIFDMHSSKLLNWSDSKMIGAMQQTVLERKI